MQEGDEEGGGVLGVSWQLLVSQRDRVSGHLSTKTVVENHLSRLCSLHCCIPISEAFVYTPM